MYEAFVDKLVQATLALKVGPAELPETTIGPVIDEEALERIDESSNSASRPFRCWRPGRWRWRTKAFTSAHIFGDVDPTSRLAREEIFGPVLAVIHVKDLDEAFDVANDSAYALTGGIFSRSPANLSRHATSCRSATSISTGESPERSSNGSPSEVSNSRASARRPAGRTICSNS